MSLQRKGAWNKWNLPPPSAGRSHDAHIAILAKGVENGKVLHSDGSGTKTTSESTGATATDSGKVTALPVATTPTTTKTSAKAKLHTPEISA
ncbi:uncharacterized protein EHS24_000960 [Apiotrichum porosum]|uniref:Uncharacterized protein n=1 Tax=Apiotrichum porosum TaxID=105984 RepID=A0A427YBG6_9TREE|nr:uncharacterized protein EHS24_000960 [Apiotrichum porosum]RSH88415.1 hypothetical protein EHS24_000960 [Apiotrichum porosum]